MRWLFLGLWVALLVGLAALVGAVSAAPTRVSLGCEAPPYPPACTVTPTPSVTPLTTITAGGRYRLYLPWTARIASGWPTPPRLTVLPEPTGGFTLIWTRAPNARLYELVELGEPTASAPIIYSVPQASEINTETLSYTIPSRRPGRYAYQVMSRNQWGASSSAAVEVSLPQSPILAIVPDVSGGFTLRWSRVPEATSYTIISANTRAMSDIIETIRVGGDQTEYSFSARSQSPLYYQVVAMTDTAGTGSSVKARPSLWGQVTFSGQPAGGVPIYLIRCSVDGSRCGNDVLLDQTLTQPDGLYSFSEVATTDANSMVYVLFDNPTENPLYLDAWVGARRLYARERVVNAGNFDIANVVLDIPIADTTTTLPTAFRWQRRNNPEDRYSLTFFDGNLALPLVLASNGYVDSYTLAALPAGLRLGTTYHWTVTVLGPDGGSGVAYHYRQITFSAALRTEPDASQTEPPTSVDLPLRLPRGLKIDPSSIP